jgi:hypothetical protein
MPVAISETYFKEICVELILAVNGKAMPLQAWTSPEGSRKLRLPDFKTVGT